MKRFDVFRIGSRYYVLDVVLKFSIRSFSDHIRAIAYCDHLNSLESFNS